MPIQVGSAPFSNPSTGANTRRESRVFRPSRGWSLSRRGRTFRQDLPTVRHTNRHAVSLGLQGVIDGEIGGNSIGENSEDSPFRVRRFQGDDLSNRVGPLVVVPFSFNLEGLRVPHSAGFFNPHFWVQLNPYHPGPTDVDSDTGRVIEQGPIDGEPQNEQIRHAAELAATYRRNLYDKNASSQDLSVDLSEYLTQ